jgi:hypothetical protein
MENDYSVETSQELREKFINLELYRPMRVRQYDAGTQLKVKMKGVSLPREAWVRLEIIKFVGGGFAGQVYQVKVMDIEEESGTIEAIKKGGIYALKILIPPSAFSKFFRNLIYRIGFQGPFQLQVNTAAVRAGALWQKFIRRSARVRFGDEGLVNDIHAVFVDETLGSCGELSEWVDGRTWRLEVDHRLDLLKRHLRGVSVDMKQLGSPEYRAKRRFMKSFVKLLNDIGAHEFARQYEWSTCKSQPNCLKRNSTENEPAEGLVAVDFRAGLALLPFLPMSPGDIFLILKGLRRGSLVQFDRGNLDRLEKFVNKHQQHFTDMKEMLAELKTCEKIYRNSVPDFTHNHIRLLYSKTLWSTILNRMRAGWRIRNIMEPKWEKRLNKYPLMTLIFCFLGAIPILGSFLRKIWARSDWRKHYICLWSSWRYLRRSVSGRCIEKAIQWHRSGRITKQKAKKLAESFFSTLFHSPFTLLPVGLHRFFTDGSYFREKLRFIFFRPIKLYFNQKMREDWLRDMVDQGQKKHILNKKDAQIIQSQIKEPYIQKYLKSLAVHVCTLPVTQIVSILVSWLYVKMNPQLSYPEAMAAVAAILVLFQITPISPGSLVRGFYVLYLVIRERNFKDYNIAVFLGFFKYIGYLAFPIQMTYRYPELARFMAGHWATEAVHVVPVFGERGALLEHWVFNLFYNWPLTLRRRMQKISEFRRSLSSRFWHVTVYIAIAAAVLALTDYIFYRYLGLIPSLKETWWLGCAVSFMCGVLITLGCGGAAIHKRVISAVVWGIFTPILYTFILVFFVFKNQVVVGEMLTGCAWRIFIFVIVATIAVIFSELRRPDPYLEKNI